MRRVLHVIACLSLLAPTAAYAAARTCQPPAVDVAQLYGKSPRQVSAELSPLVGAPTTETNQLPDGGTFARLESADLQDGVTQRFAWGGNAQGSIEVIYQRGKAQLVSLRLEEFETLDKGSLQSPCALWHRDALAQRVGIFSLPRRANSAKATRGLASYRYDLRLPGKPTWTVRMRCQNELCADVNVYFPGEGQPAPKPQDEPTFASTADILPPAAAPETFSVEATPKRKPAVAKSSRRPLRVRR